MIILLKVIMNLLSAARKQLLQCEYASWRCTKQLTDVHVCYTHDNNYSSQYKYFHHVFYELTRHLLL